ncbi:MAG: hypothetical protein KGZ58_02130 [Ignavibacteriales bacterium]|nr:hypothetical protein [Ignavibacteriales bacterium]
MNLREEILKEHSKRQTRKIADYIGNDKKRFRELMDLFFGNEYRVTQRAAWIVNECNENHPQLVQPYLKEMLEYLSTPDLYAAVKRNTVRILTTMEIPGKLLGRVATICFDFLSSPNETIAVKVHSMKVLSTICKKEKDFINELRLLIEQQVPYATSGFLACARNTLKELEKV